MRKKKIIKVPRTRNAGTMTESQFFAMIRSALREKSRWWKPTGIARLKSRRPYKGPIKRQKYEYQCNHCKQWFPIKQTQVDHIIPAGRLSSFDDLGEFAKRLFVEEDGLQILCSKCHDIKTKNEKE